jgi:hypothetical protein
MTRVILATGLLLFTGGARNRSVDGGGPEFEVAAVRLALKPG